MLHNSGSTFNTDNATRVYSPGTQGIVSRSMLNSGGSPSEPNLPAYSLDDVASLPYIEIFDYTNVDGFVLSAAYDYEMILEGEFSTANSTQTYDIVFYRCNIDAFDTPINLLEIARFSSTAGQNLSFRKYRGINMDYESTRNNFVWGLENTVGSGSLTTVYGDWSTYIIEARREITGNV